MPVVVDYKMREAGWKKEANDRFGHVLVMKFKNAVDDKRLFEFSPTIQDCHDMIVFAQKVLEVDKHNKALYSIKKQLEFLSERGKGVNSCQDIMSEGMSVETCGVITAKE